MRSHRHVETTVFRKCLWNHKHRLSESKYAELDFAGYLSRMREVCEGFVASQLKCTRTRQHCAVVDSVEHCAHPIANSILKLGDGVLVRALDEDRAAVGILTIFDKEVPKSSAMLSSEQPCR
jgi:hypothetical protein